MKSFLWRHKFLILIWAVAFTIGGYILFTVLGTSKDGEENPYTISTTEQTANDAKTPQTLQNQVKKISVGQTTQDGNLEMAVKDVKCNGETSIGENQYARADAEGQYCRVNISIKNVGNTAANLLLSSQKAFVAENNSYTPAVDATQYAQADQTKGYWFEQIAPNQSVSGELVFDVYRGGKIITVELHGAENSPGIRVSL